MKSQQLLLPPLVLQVLQRAQQLNSLNEFSFFITVFPECKGDLKIKNISNDLSYQYENIDKRLKNFIDLTNYFETVFYPPSSFEYYIKDSLLNY
jgi:hypothetical protein